MKKKPIKVILTGATGMVGEGVLMECLASPEVVQVLSVVRKSTGKTDPKLTEIVVRDFSNLSHVEAQLTGYDACFYCAGVSAVGMKEVEYTQLTYELTTHFAATLATLNPDMVFGYISGAGTDSTEKGRMMWARVKGKTENALLRLPFKKAYNFRPGAMKPTDGQQYLKFHNKLLGFLYPAFRLLLPNTANTVKELGLAMIRSVTRGYPNVVLEVKDIKALGKS